MSSGAQYILTALEAINYYIQTKSPNSDLLSLHFSSVDGNEIPTQKPKQLCSS